MQPLYKFVKAAIKIVGPGCFERLAHIMSVEAAPGFKDSEEGKAMAGALAFLAALAGI